MKIGISKELPFEMFIFVLSVCAKNVMTIT